MDNKITVNFSEGECYFHVMGDYCKYFDLDALVDAHNELKQYCSDNGVELNMMLLRKMELVGSV